MTKAVTAPDVRKPSPSPLEKIRGTENDRAVGRAVTLQDLLGWAFSPFAAAMGAPSGGVTIAEVWQRKAELAGSQVTVQGRVVKYNAAILGRNWVHIQDGSGDAAAGDNDLIVTTKSTTEVGETVVLTGNIVLDKDFGAGYSYPVLIEDASITNE